MNKILAYTKAHIALVGVTATWYLATYPNGKYERYVAAGVGLLTALGVLTVPNKGKSVDLLYRFIGIDGPQGSASRLRLLPKPTGLKLGRGPKTHDHRDLKLCRYDLTTSVPKSVDWAKAVPAWGMLLNDALGDCTIAGALHAVQTWACNAGKVFVPTDAQALTLYEQVDGYNPAVPSTDQGGVLRTVLAYWKRTGMAGHKVLAYVSVDPTDETEIKTAIAQFGCLYVGVNLPLAAQSQGVTWRKTSGNSALAGSWGGHCVILTGYNSSGVNTVTWGQEGTATWGWLKAYMDEAWAAVSPDWMNAAGVDPSGINLAGLEKDLTALTSSGCKFKL